MLHSSEHDFLVGIFIYNSPLLFWLSFVLDHPVWSTSAEKSAAFFTGLGSNSPDQADLFCPPSSNPPSPDEKIRDRPEKG